MTASAFASLLRARKIGRDSWIAKCPAHPDRHPSLSIRSGRKTAIVFKCQSNGCEAKDILDAMGLKWGDVLGERAIDPEIVRQIRLAEEKRQYLREERTRLLWLAAEKAEFWRRRSQVLGRSLAKWPEQDKLAQEFHYALAQQRRCEQIWVQL